MQPRAPLDFTDGGQLLAAAKPQIAG
jgi:hypothetical protein